MAAGIHTKDVFELTGGNDHARCGNKTCNHRVGKEVGQKAQLEHAHRKQDRPGKNRKCQGSQRITHRAGFGNIAHRRRRHQGHNRHRANRKCAAGAKDGIKNDRRDGGIKPCLGRQTSQQRIGKRLRDQHDRHDHSCNHVIAKGRPVIGLSPVKNRDIFPKHVKAHQSIS